MAITVEALNYRALKRTRWSPSGVCALAGPNGSGKTTLLGLFDFFRLAFARGVSAAIEAMGGVWGLRHAEAAPEDPLAVALAVGDLRWELTLSVRGTTLDDHPSEVLTRGGDLLLSRAAFSDQIEYRGEKIASPGQSGFSRVWDARRDDLLAPLVRGLEALRVYRGHNLWGLRQNGSRQSANHFLNPTAENAFSVLRNWRDRREHRPRFDFVLRHLRSAFPDLCADLDFDLAGLTVSVGMVQPRTGLSVPAYFAPNGWLTALLHLCAVAGAEPGSLVAIDEMENTLHPFAIRHLLGAFRQWADEQDLTVVIATHSPVVLDEFKGDLGQVFVMESSEPELPVPLPSIRDPEWLRQFSIGQLYGLGEFGSQCPERAIVPGRG